MRCSLLRFIGLYLAVSLLAGSVLSVSAQNAPELDLERIQRATVFVIQASADDLSTRCVGTGTLVRYDGLILTNAHNTLPSANCPGDELVIAMSSAPDEPPVPRYRAEIAGADSGLDLALLRITRELDGRLIEPGSLPVLPFVDIADVGGVNLDQTITVVGYPGIGNQSVQSIAGTVTGFIAEPGQGNRSWIKTTAVEPIPGTMSGGGAYNQRGELIGVPTTAPVRVGDEAGSCRLLEDTNDDGFINSNDSCVPIGDFIDVLRPASFARPLVRSASLGLTVENLTASSVRNTTTEPPSIVRDRLFFALSVDNGLPDSVISSAPAGTTSLYLFFDYRNFTPQTIYELRVSINGTPSPEFSLPPVQWSGGTSGLWYIGSSGQPWPNGTYEFRLFVDGLSAASKAITIGGPAQQRPTFSKVAFGLLDDSGVFQGESYVLPAGNTVEARFIYRNMQPGMNWGAVWYFNGGVLTQQQSSWAANAELTDPVNGTRPVSIDVAQGLQPGNYRLELYIQQPGSDRPTLSAMGEFVVAGQPEGVLPDVFSEPLFFRASNTLEQPTGNPSGTFPDGANTLYARFDWSTIAPGTLWTMRWEVDGTIFYEQTVPWRVGNTGSDYSVRVTAPGGLPDGTYTMSLLINDILLEVSEVSVGIGQLEIDRLAQTGGVQLRGQIVDAVTGEGIEGASFILISEDFSVADFTWRQEQIYALAITDSNGEFEIDRLLQIGSPYSVLIEIEGYLPIARDAFTFNEETLAEVGGSPVDMYIPMTRD